MMRQPDRAPRKARLDPPLLLAFLLPVFAVAPLAYPGYFELRSGFLPIFALTDRLARLGDLTWAPAVGLNYSFFGGDGALPYWLAALPSALGADRAGALKWVLAASLVAGSIGAFFWARRRWPDGWPALVAAAIYVLNPLTLSLVYAEGAFAAVVLLGLLPWTLWAVDVALAGRRSGALAVALFVAAALWTQPALAQGQLAVLLAYILYVGFFRRRGAFALALLGLAGGLLLGALLSLPVIAARGFGEMRGLPLSAWLALALPWLALAGGWIAARLGWMLEEDEQAMRPALFAGLLALVLLVAYNERRPVELPGPVPPAPLAIFGDNEIALLAVTTTGQPGPGGEVAVDVKWQALKPLGRDYTVFFHVIGPDGQRVGQRDTVPGDGKAPTSGWQPGRVVSDRYVATLSPSAPIVPDAGIGGSYQYWLGWYDGATGQRLGTLTDDKYVFLPEK